METDAQGIPGQRENTRKSRPHKILRTLQKPIPAWNWKVEDGSTFKLMYVTLKKKLQSNRRLTTITQGEDEDDHSDHRGDGFAFYTNKILFARKFHLLVFRNAFE